MTFSGVILVFHLTPAKALSCMRIDETVILRYENHFQF